MNSHKPDFEKMYYELAAKVADAIDLLIAAQQRGEDEYVEDMEEPTDEAENRD